MVITMAKLRMAHASTHGARKPPGPIRSDQVRYWTSVVAHTIPPICGCGSRKVGILLRKRK